MMGMERAQSKNNELEVLEISQSLKKTHIVQS
jgi:hypothetical protein